MESILDILTNKKEMLNIFYALMGFISIVLAFGIAKRDVENKVYYVLFYTILGLVLILGGYVEGYIVGALIVCLGLISVTKKVKPFKLTNQSQELKDSGAKKFGASLFVPAFAIGIVTVIVILINPKLGSLVALGYANVVAFILTRVFVKEKFVSQVVEGSSLLLQLGTVIILPTLLASLGYVFNKAGVGAIISDVVEGIDVKDNLFMSVALYCTSMAAFTIIMGNAFAAFAVITAGIGMPLIYSQGADPAIAGLLAMISGYCGTLVTPMAANFNIVPALLLETKSQYAGIKAQIPLAGAMLITNIFLMYYLAF